MKFGFAEKIKEGDPDFIEAEKFDVSKVMNSYPRYNAQTEGTFYAFSLVKHDLTLFINQWNTAKRFTPPALIYFIQQIVFYFLKPVGRKHDEFSLW